MKFWDSSALVAIAVEEDATQSIRTLAREDPELIVWMLSDVEIASALWRRRRNGDMEETIRADAQRQMDAVLADAVAVSDVAGVIRRARRLLGSHPLRAADAMQLAAALVACEDEPARLPIVTLDTRLADSAAREGFLILP